MTTPGLCPDPIPDDIQEELATLRARVKELEAQVKAGIQSHYEVEQVLGRALGYVETDGTVCVGEHVPETLAEEAAKKIKHLFDEFDRNTRLIRSGPQSRK